MLWFTALEANANQVEALPLKSAEQCRAPGVVASFLGFRETQLAQFGDLLAQFRTTPHAFEEQIAARQAQLDAVLGQPTPPPVIVGSLFLKIHALQQQVGQAIQSFQGQLASLLTEEQKQKVQAVTLASQLPSVVRAFVALHLVPAPTPLPCQQP